MNEKAQKLQHILDKATDHRKVFGTSFCVKHKGEMWCGASGNLKAESQYFIASTTKLFVTAIILKFRSEGRLKLDEKIADYLDDNILNRLHVLNGHDYSREITLKNLLAHTSGIPDYFQQKDKSGKSIEDSIKEGNDRFWTFEEVIEYNRSLKPLFKPDAKGKAHYSDTNYQLLGRIIENMTGKSVSENFYELIFNPLKLTQTYLYSDIEDNRPKTLYYKNRELHIPKAMTSFGADGGVVSTSEEMITFLEAFFNGAFFPKSYVNELQIWNKLFFPLESGIGIHRIKMPWFFNPMGTIPELIGHSGLSGALAYHNAEKDFYIAGTVNQVAYPSTSFTLAFKLLQEILRK